RSFPVCIFCFSFGLFRDNWASVKLGIANCVKSNYSSGSRKPNPKQIDCVSFENKTKRLIVSSPRVCVC
ncbi:AGAP007735-PA, partial [Anopheles gambiae str. PEST]|uniref:Secreted protein n=2 Tax=gambiae species complex TaxID=44542 RepID=A0A6E8VUM2_ANOCL